jgi:hypothetical protein
MAKSKSRKSAFTQWKEARKHNKLGKRCFIVYFDEITEEQNTIANFITLLERRKREEDNG